MSRYILIFIVLNFTPGLLGVSTTAYEIDPFLWNEIEESCKIIEIIRNSSMNILDYIGEVMKLNIVEYVEAGGYRSHVLFPVGAYSLMNSDSFDVNRPTVVFIHGFTSSATSPPAMTVGNAYRRHGGYNVLALNSSALIGSFYGQSAARVTTIGEYFGYFLYQLHRLGVKSESIHLIGHSLGAHIAGFSGKSFSKLTLNKLPRITALDPARPCFYWKNSTKRLDHTDAEFVDVIHTNGGVLGMNNSIGQVDFYPNGGSQQPGCPEISSCSHEKAWEYYAESVNDPKKFISLQCDNWNDFTNGICNDNGKAFMGIAVNNTTRGDYYLQTTTANEHQNI